MSFSIDGNTIWMTRGDTFSATVAINQPSGLPYEMQTGDSVRFAMKHSEMTAGQTAFIDQTPLVVKTIPTDTLLLQMNPEDTDGLDFGSYKYDIELTFADGGVCTFIPNADLILTPDVHSETDDQDDSQDDDQNIGG